MSEPGRVIAERDGLVVTAGSGVDDEMITRFRALYLAAFGPLRRRAAARHVLHDDEFDADLRDPRVTKIIAWRDGVAVGMTTVTTELAAVPWISPEFYAARYPDAAARRAIHYFGFALVDPSHSSTGVLGAMLEPRFTAIAAERGLVAYDVCTFNIDTVDLPAKLATIFARIGDHTTERVDTQTYFVTNFQ